MTVSKLRKSKLDRVSTGVEGLDRILGGGLPDLSINIIMGRPGTGKSILTDGHGVSGKAENGR